VVGVGWCVMVVQATSLELSFLLDILQECNGQYIFSAATLSHVVDLREMRNKVTQILATDADIDNLYVSNDSESHAFVYMCVNMCVILSSTRSRRRGDQATENCWQFVWRFH
jgi:hypothetical protein